MAETSSGHDASALGRVAQSGAGQRFVGVLRPEVGLAPLQPIQIENSELVIGRQPGLGLSLADEWVSRRHATIRPLGDEFVLDDLDSSNGTYVDGVPIVSCVLRPGDWIQIGRSLFRFELRLADAVGLEGLSTWLE